MNVQDKKGEKMNFLRTEILLFFAQIDFWHLHFLALVIFLNGGV